MTDATPYWTRTGVDLATSLSSGAQGLTAADAAGRLPAARSRALRDRTHANGWRLLARQFASPIVLILVGATVLSGILGDWTDAIIILVIIVLSGLLDFVQERGADAAIRELLATVRLTATAVRGGVDTAVPFDEIVPGDVIRLAGGDILPADAVVLASNGLELDQSSLTGETFPAAKTAAPSGAGTALADRANVVYMGTHVASGSGTAIIVATGRDTEFGQVVSSVEAKPRATGFERGMTRFGLLLARVMVVLVVLIFAANLLLQRPIVDSALFSLSLAVGLTPQLLPAIVGISLAQGARAIAKHRVIVKRLNAIEDFGAMNVLCTDKTGTMTQGSIHLDRAVAVDGSPSATLLRLAALNATLQQGLANPLDDAIAAASTAAGVDLRGAASLGEVPYDFDRKRLSVLVGEAGAAPLLVTKGAVHAVLDACSQVRRADGSVVPIAEGRAVAEATEAALSGEGMRVLAVATRSLAAGATVGVGDEAGLTLEGLLAFADPVKPDAAGTIADFATAGVSVRMITGDAKAAAAHIAGQLGLDSAAIATGAELDAWSDAELATHAPDISVYCETSPHHKERIIAAISHSGATVGYMGDGINDAPALKAADVGISVRGAADVATQSASIVMLDNDLRALLDGMRQGRRTFANTMKYIFMTTSANFGNMISMAIASVVLPFLPLLASQILMINLLTDLPATAIATDNVDDRQVAHPQRWNMTLIRNYMIVFGVVSSAFDIISFVLLRLVFHAAETEFQSAWFLGSVLTEVFVLFVLRTRGPSWRSRPSPILVALSVAVVALTFLIVLTPIGGLFRLAPPPAELTWLVIAIAIAYCVATELTKVVFWRVPSHAHPAPHRPAAHPVG